VGAQENSPQTVCVVFPLVFELAAQEARVQRKYMNDYIKAAAEAWGTPDVGEDPCLEDILDDVHAPAAVLAGPADRCWGRVIVQCEDFCVVNAPPCLPAADRGFRSPSTSSSAPRWTISRPTCSSTISSSPTRPAGSPQS
jgi:hypothetical protein